MKKFTIGLLLAMCSVLSYAEISEVGEIKLYKEVIEIDAQECLRQYEEIGYCVIYTENLLDHFIFLKNSQELRTHTIQTSCTIKTKRYYKGFYVHFSVANNLKAVTECIELALHRNEFKHISTFEAIRKQQEY